MKLRKPNIFTDGGPWAEHDQACCVCHVRHAVLNLNSGHFQPCWQCQGDGWRLLRFNKFWRKYIK